MSSAFDYQLDSYLTSWDRAEARDWELDRIVAELTQRMPASFEFEEDADDWVARVVTRCDELTDADEREDVWCSLLQIAKNRIE